LENAGPEWRDQCVSVFPLLFDAGDMVTGEDIRLAVSDTIGEPHHHNAWGAMIRYMVGRKMIWATGKYKHMKTRRSHGRMTPVYRVRPRPGVWLV
jgi:hypothetical protein